MFLEIKYQKYGNFYNISTKLKDTELFLNFLQVDESIT